MNDGESNQRRYEEDGAVVLVTETENAAKDRGHKVCSRLEIYAYFSMNNIFVFMHICGAIMIKCFFY